MTFLKRAVGTAVTAAVLLGMLAPASIAADIHINTLRGSKQMVLAETSDRSSSYATISAYEEISQGNWVLKAHKTHGRVGSKGIEPIESRKQETKKTPEGIMRLQAAYGLADNPGTLFQYHPITNNMYWDLNSNSKNYNRLVYSNPGGDYEHLIKYKTYKYMFTTDYNSEQIKGKGGAIFLHCNGSGATSGCVSMPRNDMKWCMTWLDPKKNPSLVVTTTQEKYKYLTPDSTTITTTHTNVGNTVCWKEVDGAAQYEIQKARSANGVYTTVHISSNPNCKWLDPAGSAADYYRIITSNKIDGKVGFTATSNISSPQMPFNDVPVNTYYYAPVVWAVANGVTKGTSATIFSPNASCTRAQVVQMIYNLAKRPDTDDMEMPFTDVPDNTWYTDAVNWAFHAGVTAGTSETTFSPNQVCTRAQIVQMLWRMYGVEKEETVSNFTDVSSSDWFYEAVNWAAAHAITNGTSPTTFSPYTNCTRAQIVTLLYKTLGQ